MSPDTNGPPRGKIAPLLLSPPIENQWFQVELINAQNQTENNQEKLCFSSTLNYPEKKKKEVLVKEEIFWFVSGFLSPYCPSSSSSVFIYTPTFSRDSLRKAYGTIYDKWKIINQMWKRKKKRETTEASSGARMKYNYSGSSLLMDHTFVLPQGPHLQNSMSRKQTQTNHSSDYERQRGGFTEETSVWFNEQGP